MVYTGTYSTAGENSFEIGIHLFQRLFLTLIFKPDFQLKMTVSMYQNFKKKHEEGNKYNAKAVKVFVNIKRISQNSLFTGHECIGHQVFSIVLG